MQLCVLFGLPGAGKTYVGKVFEKDFGFFVYDGDVELPEDMDLAIRTQTPVSDEMRDRFFRKIIGRMHSLKNQHERIVITQTFIKEKYRKWILEQVPNAQFVLIQTNDSIREARLMSRKEYPLDLEYARKMVKNFEKPEIRYKVIENNEEGAECIRGQVQRLLRRSSSQ